MTTRIFTAEEVDELTDDAETELVGTWRWGYVRRYVVEVDGEHWMFDVRIHHEDGMQNERETTATKCRKVERVVSKWEPIP